MLPFYEPDIAICNRPYSGQPFETKTHNNLSLITYDYLQ